MTRSKRCSTCLWWWDLYDTDEWICYNEKSPFLHMQCRVGCPKHEDVIHKRMGMKMPRRGKKKKED